MSNSKEIISVLRKYGTCLHAGTGRNDPGLYVTVCAGCGKEIRSDAGELDKVAYSITKRGTAVIFHADCLRETFDAKIPPR